MSYMSQADGLLNSLLAYPSAEPVVEGDNIIIGTDRFWLVPEKLKKIGVQYDHNIETITFDCPRYWDGIDMSMMKVYINYMRSDGTTGIYLCENVRVDNNDSTLMHFDWIISANVTQIHGTLSTLICIKKTDSDGNEVNHWNSELCTELFVSEGMQCTEIPLKKYPDIITQLLTRMETTEENNKNWIEDTDKELEDWKKQVEQERDDWEAAYKANYDARMLKMEQNTSPSAMSRHTKDYIDGNPEVMQGHVDEYMENNDRVVQHVNDFITNNMDSLINAGLLEINHKAVIERSGNVAPTVKGNALLDGMKGDSWQNVTAIGKNLWLHGDLRFTTVENKNINLASGTYTISALVTTGSPDNTSEFVFYAASEEIARIPFVANTGERVSSTATLGKNITSISIYSMGKGSSSGYSATWSDIQIEAGSAVTEFEEYRPPSPSPEKPSVIHSVGSMGWFDGEWLQGVLNETTGAWSNNDYRVYSPSYIPCKEGDIINIICEIPRATRLIYYDKDKLFTSSVIYSDSTSIPSNVAYFRMVILSTVSVSPITPSTVGHVCVTINGKYALIVDEVGKNLFDGKYVNYWIDVNGNLATYSGYVTSDFIRVKQGVPYYFSKIGGSASCRGVCKYDKNKNYLGTVYLVVTNGSSDTYTFTDNTCYIRVLAPIGLETQVEEGASVATPYSPHQSARHYIPLDEPLRAIGDVRDEIVCQNGVYGALRKIKEVTFDGSESGWYASTTTPNLYDMPTNDMNPDTSNIICSHYTYKYANENGCVYASRSILAFCDTTCASLDEFVAKVQANPITVVYELETPVFTPFEDQYIFWNFKSFDGATNIYILGSSENVTPVATFLLPKTVDGSLGNHAIVETKKTEAFVQDVLADGRIRFRIGDDGELEYSIFTEEEVAAGIADVEPAAVEPEVIEEEPTGEEE